MRRLFRRSSFALGTIVVLLLGFAFGYRYHGSLRCSACGAPLERNESGLAASLNYRVPLYAEISATPRAAQIERFLAAGHVHQPGKRGYGFRMDGPFLGATIGCARQLGGNGFTRYLEGDDDFANYIAARIADGKVSLATVREILAVPAELPRGYASDSDRAAVLRAANELVAGYTAADPRELNVWMTEDCDPMPIPSR
jgi:hypothetical protein